MAEPTIRIKRSSVAGKIPTTDNLALGELAINTYDGKIFLEQDQNGVGVGTTVITVNPWNVGLGSDVYDINFTVGNVGIGNTLPTSKLDVDGDAQFTGVVTATSFVGPLTGNVTGDLIGTADYALALAVTTGIITAAAFNGQELVIDNVRIGTSDDNTIDTSSGNLILGSDGSNSVAISTNLDVSGVIQPSTGDSGSSGIIWATDPGGGVGDEAFIKYYAESGENTRLHIRIQNEADDDIYLDAQQTTISGDLVVSSGIAATSINVTGVVTATSFVGDGSGLTGVIADSAGTATYATSAGIATYAETAGIATYADNAGIATYATSAGIATYADNAGIATYATSAGIATYAETAGIATYATSAGIATYAETAGIATYATSAGIATYADFAGIATASSISTYATSAGIATYAETAGIATYATSAGIATSSEISTYATSAGIATYSDNSGISTDVIGGIASITQLYVSGISTFTGISTVTGQTLFVKQISSLGVITASTFDGNLNDAGKAYYVSVNGSDSNSGNNINKPFATIVQALSVATAGDTVFVESGTFTEVFPLTVPAGVTVRGVGLRATVIQPTSGTRQNDGFLLNGETTVEDLTVANVYEPGYAFKFADNAKTTTRSPYIQRVTVLNRGSVTSSEDPYGFDSPHNPPTTYKAGRGVLIDGSVQDPTSLEPAMLFNECTFICPNNIALEMTNGARTEWVNCFAYFADKGIYAHDGNVGFASTGRVRIKTTGFSGTTPAANDELYYLESNSQSGTYEQSGIGLTITKVGHGLTVGDRIFADFTSGTATDGFYRVTGYVGVNTFSVTMTGSDTTSGNVSYKEALGFGTVTAYSSGLSSITSKGEGLFELPSTRLGKTVTAFGNASLSTTQKKFGTASLILDGNGDYVSVASNTDFGFGTSDFTVEGFVRLSGIGTDQQLFDFRDSSAEDTSLHIGIAGTDSVKVSYGSTEIISSVTTLSADNWYHIAVSRSSGSTKLFIDGTQEGNSYSDSNDYGASKPLVVGSDYSGSNNLNGYVDEVRISNTARYTGTFTPTTTPFNSDGNDRLLLHFDGITGSVSFTDSSIPIQDIRWVRSGVGIATATKITLADYQQFGAEMRSIGSAVVFGNTGISADGPGVGLRLFAFNFGHIGSGKDFSQDISLVNQEAEVVSTNNANVYFVSIDQSGDFRVGDAFYVNQEAGTVNFGGQDFTLNSLSDLNITDGTNTTTITPTTATIGSIQISGNEIISTSGDITINPSGNSDTIISGDASVTGSITASDTINSQNDVQINGVSVLTTASADAVALAIALG